VPYLSAANPKTGAPFAVKPKMKQKHRKCGGDNKNAQAGMMSEMGACRPAMQLNNSPHAQKLLPVGSGSGSSKSKVGSLGKLFDSIWGGPGKRMKEHDQGDVAKRASPVFSNGSYVFDLELHGDCDTPGKSSFASRSGVKQRSTDDLSYLETKEEVEVEEEGWRKFQQRPTKTQPVTIPTPRHHTHTFERIEAIYI